MIAALGLTAAGALAAGVAVLLSRPGRDADAGTAAQSPESGAPAGPRISGCYSFISGYQDAAPVELCLDYDPEKFSFAVVEEDFLSPSGDSHVALLAGEDFKLQLEYAAYYSGEDFQAHCRQLAETHQQRGELRCGALEGVWVLEGDNLRISLPIPGDAYSYVLLTVQKTPDYDDELTTLPDYPPFRELLSTLRLRRG